MSWQSNVTEDQSGITENPTEQEISTIHKTMDLTLVGDAGPDIGMAFQYRNVILAESFEKDPIARFRTIVGAPEHQAYRFGIDRPGSLFA